MSNRQGALYVVATPIGNLGDISSRALDTLRAVDLIAAEDTRHSSKLLQHFAITTPVTALHEHNERRACATLIERLRDGATIALISDAGTPLLSDPGYHLVNAAHEHGVRVVPIPGPSSIIAALSASGLQADRFMFEGFLPARQAARRARLAELQRESRTWGFFEAPHRIVDALADLRHALGDDRLVVIARELTKTFETVHRGRAGEVATWVQADPNRRKGEFVVIVQGAPVTPDAEADAHARRVLQLLLAALPLKQAVSITAQITNASRNRVYDLAIALRGPGDEG